MPHDLDSLLREALTIWGAEPMTLDHIVAAMGVVYGDVCRAARAVHEGADQEQVTGDLRRELGNLIVSSIRWANCLGLDPAACVSAAMQAQRSYAERLAR